MVKWNRILSKKLRKISVNESKFNAVKREVLKKVFSRMNPEQQKAIFHIRGPVLILAGAGSGKTTVLVNRVLNMIRFGNAYESDFVKATVTDEDLTFLERYLAGEEEDEERLTQVLENDPVRPWQILAITFTNKAAGELKSRIAQALGEEIGSDVMACTFHSLCVRILRRYIDALGFEKSFTIYDTDDSVRVAKECLKELNLSDKLFPPKQLLSMIGRAKDELLEPGEYELRAGGDYKKQVAAKVYHKYQQKLKASNALDFDDLIAMTVKLFTEHPDILEFYQRRYRYVMVDEYQDTNHAQYRLVSLLSQSHRNLCVVGDDDQSIYKFRGATIENILSFEDQFDDVVTIRLEQNYRSTQKILDAANSIIRHNTARKGKELWTGNGEGQSICVYTADDETDEAAFVAATIEQNVAQGEKYGGHAILYRMNAQSRSLESYFVKAGIPYRIIGAIRFFERKEIKDVVAYLSVINNPSDSLRLRRIINEPKRGIGAATVESVYQMSQVLGQTMLEVMQSADQYASLSRKREGLMQFGKMLQGLIDMADEGASLSELFDAMLEETGYLRALEAEGDEGQARIENIDEFKSTILQYESDNEEPTLFGFLEEISLYTDLDHLDSQEDSVILMTIHSAKGLEFDHVFLVGMEDGIFPGNNALLFPEEMEEERRLAYVGVTRAKKELVITNARQRMLFGSTNRNRPSRFISEIPAEIKEIKGLKTTHFGKRNEEYAPQPRNEAAHAIGIGPGSGKKSVAGSGSFSETFAPGDAVSHKIFGNGMVLSATPMGNDTLVEVAFDKVGTKKIMANFAKLYKK